MSSSSLTIGTIIGSVTKLKDNIIPETSWNIIVNITTNPNMAFTSWNDTFKTTKYTISFLTDNCLYAWLTNLLHATEKLHLNALSFKKLIKLYLVVGCGFRKVFYFQNIQDFVKSHVFIDSSV